MLVSACNMQTSGKKAADINVRVGFNGILMEFMKNTPPVKIFEDDAFPVIIRLRNDGAYTIDKDKAVLSLGVEKDYTKALKLQTTERISRLDLGKQSSDEPAAFGLNGKTSLNPTGDYDVISYNLQAGKVDPQSEAHASTVIATVCYPYQTILDTTTCIDTDISSTKPGKKVCKMEDINFNGGQGGPVSVTRIEVNMLPTAVNEQTGDQKIKPQFLIFIENMGKGNVIQNGVEKDYCTKSEVTHDKLNKIFVKASLGGKELYCPTNRKDFSDEKKDGYVKLVDKKALARCILTDGISRADETYLSPLRIELTYGYTQSILANYFIQKATG